MTRKCTSVTGLLAVSFFVIVLYMRVENQVRPHISRESKLKGNTYNNGVLWDNDDREVVGVRSRLSDRMIYVLRAVVVNTKPQLVCCFFFVVFWVEPEHIHRKGSGYFRYITYYTCTIHHVS